jgi:hypothetical protein
MSTPSVMQIPCWKGNEITGMLWLLLIGIEERKLAYLSTHNASFLSRRKHLVVQGQIFYGICS